MTKKTSTIGFLDLVQNTLVAFIMLFIIAFMMIKPIDEKPDPVQKAEYIITVTWNSKSNDDVDSWLQLPTGEIIYFQNKMTPAAHLDRDDLGHSTDTITHRNGDQEIIFINQEILTIRGIIEGEWTLNVHMYSKRTKGVASIVVTIDKLNPYFRDLTKTVTLKKKGDEKTVVRFMMDRDGFIRSTNDIPKKLVEQKTIETHNSSGP